MEKMPDNSTDIVDESESEEIYQQNMMQMGKTARTIAGKLHYPPMMTKASLPSRELMEAKHDDYLEKDRSREVFFNENISEWTKATYADIIDEHPELRTVEIVSTSGDYGGSFETWTETRNDPSKHMVVTGDFSEGMINDRISESEYYANKIISIRLAMELGCNPQDIFKNERLQRDMLLLHEMGHANNFVNKYLKPIYRKGIREGANPKIEGVEDGVFSVGLTWAAAEYGMRSDVPVNTRAILPGSIASPKEAVEAGLCRAGQEEAYEGNIYRRLVIRFLAGGATNEEELALENARRYRTSDEEHSADQFAIDYITSHLDKYFLGLGVDDDGSGRIQMSGGEMDITKEFGAALNYVTGNEVMIKSEEGEMSRGRFVEAPAKGEELLITTSDDPRDESGYMSFGIVQEAKYQTVIDEQGKRHRKITVCTDKGKYSMSEAREVHRMITRTPDDLRERLGIEKGQELQMMSLLTSVDPDADIDESGEYDDALGTGGILYGRVENDIKIGEPIVLMWQSDPEHLTEWRSWPVEKIEQDWRFWRIHTKVGNKRVAYEIIPLPD